MRKYLKLYWKFITVTIRKQTMYRSTYIAGIIGQWLGYGTTFATLYIMVKSFKTLNGWNASEVMLLYGFSVLAYAIGAAFFYNPCIELADKIKSGEFDQSLIKPIHPFIHEMFQGFNAGYLSHLTISLVVIGISISKLGVSLSVTNVLNIFIMLFGAVLIQASVLIVLAATSFFTINENPLIDFLLFDMKRFIDYPITIFPRIIQILLTFILPYAFINFYPAVAILGKEMPSGYPRVLSYASPVIGILVFTLSIHLWNFGLKQYKSSGS